MVQASTIEVLLVVYIVGVYFSTPLASLLKWNERRYKRKGLAIGTMWWPLFGESTKLLTRGPLDILKEFFLILLLHKFVSS